MKSPLVTVVIPAFNHERFVREAVESVLNQDFTDWELLIINDGSTDSTSQIVDSYRNHPKITVIHQQNMGLSATLNKGLGMARGIFFNFLPSDDFFHTEKLSKQVQKLKEEDIVCLFCDQIAVDESGKNVDDPIKKWHSVPYKTGQEILPRLFERNFIPAPSALIRVSELRAIGGFDESLTYTQDYDLWLRILSRGKAFWLHEPLLYYRWHGENLTYKADEAINFERAYLLTKALKALSVSDIFPYLKTLQGEPRKHEEAKKLLELANYLLKSGLIELLPWCRLLINQATTLDPEVNVPKILLKRLENRKEFIDLRDERLVQLSRKLAFTEGELANFKVHVKDSATLIRLKNDYERYKREVPDILSERKQLRKKAEALWEKEKKLVKWNSSLDEKHRWLENYHKDLQAKEAYLNRPQVLWTLRVISFLSRFKNPVWVIGQGFWHLLPLNIRARFGPRLKQKIINHASTLPADHVQTPEPTKTCYGSTSLQVSQRERIRQEHLKFQTIVASPPLVSVVLPIYNHARIARLSIESILNQQYPNIQIIVVNDGSTDGLLEVLSPYVGRKNITILDQENQRLPKALSNGFRFAKGAFLTWTSADNIMLPWQIELETDFLLRNPEIDMTYGDVEIIDGNGQPFTNSNYRVQNQDPKGSSTLKLPAEIQALDAVADNFINAAFLYRQTVFQALGHYDPRLLGTEDFDYWLRTKELFNIKKLDQNTILYQYRVHDDSLSGRYGDTHIVSNVKKLISDHKERKNYYQKPFTVLVLSNEPVDRDHPLFCLVKGLNNVSCSSQVVVLNTLNSLSGLELTHIFLSELKETTSQCLQDKMAILCFSRDGIQQVIEVLKDKDLWVGFLDNFHQSKQINETKTAFRRIIFDDPLDFLSSAPENKDELLLLLAPLDPPSILRKARDDRFPFWQFPWQGDHVILYVGQLTNIDEQFAKGFAERFSGLDFVFASRKKDDKKACKTLFQLKNVHFFHYETLEQLYPLISGISAFWAPLKDSATRSQANRLYGWALASARPFLCKSKFRYSDDAPFWHCLDPENNIKLNLAEISTLTPDRKICDAFLEKHSPSKTAQFLLAAANNDLFIEKKCGGRKLFRPKMPHVLAPKSKRPHIVLEINSMDKGGLEEVVYNLSSMFDRTRFRPTIAVIQKGGMLSKKAQRTGLEIEILGEDVSKYGRFLKEEKVALVNSHYSEFGARVTRDLSIPNIATIHNAYVWFDRSQRQHFRKMDDCYDHYIAVSSLVKQYLTDVLGISSSKISVVPNGVDTIQLQLLSQVPPRVSRKTLGLSEEDFVFLNPASLDGRKNHHGMISAVSKIIQQHPNIKLICAGNVLNGAYFETVRKRVSKLGLEKHILFPGFIKEKADLYRLADALLLPSVVEGWSIAMTEALFFGLPLVLTDVGGARDVINEDWIGIIVPNSFGDVTKLRGENLGKYTQERNPKNTDQLVQAMEDMATRKEFWQSHSMDRRRLVEKHYSVENMVKKTKEVYEKFL